MRRKRILLGMIAMAVLSFSGCVNDKNDKTTEVVTEASSIEESITAEDMTELTTEATEVTTEDTTESAQATDYKLLVVGDGLDESQEYYENMYRDVLNFNYKTLSGGIDNYEYADGTSGIGEIVMNGSENAIDIVGYTFIDSNDDGIAELVIGAIYEERDGKYYGENLYSVYTYDVTPQLILEGWSRNRCYLLNDATFFTEGSSGAIYNVFENYRLGKNDIELSCIDYYFTKEKDDTFQEIGFYHNKTAEWEVAVSEEMVEDEYWNILTAYTDRVIPLEFTPFSNYEYVENQSGSKEVTVEWITKEELYETQMGGFVADTSEFEVIAAITSSERIMDLNILSLTYEGVDDMDNIVFSTEKLYSYGDFDPGNPFAVTLTLYGTIPSYGISYVTADGVTHYYAIGESGMDGSAVLIEFVVKE